MTDVLYRDASGNVGVLKSGRKDLVPLTHTPVAMKDLRFGDFDGDGKTDIFYTWNGQWQVWYGSTRSWKPTETSGKTIDELLFGEFDDVRGTDVAAVANGAWSYSSASTKPWAPLNKKLSDSFKDAVAADFDGNGKTDIAFGSGSAWRFSRDGRAPLADLRTGSGLAPLKGKLLIGRFDGGARAMVVTFEPSIPLIHHEGTKLVIWRGLGSGNEFKPWTRQDMR